MSGNNYYHSPSRSSDHRRRNDGGNPNRSMNGRGGGSGRYSNNEQHDVPAARHSSHHQQRRQPNEPPPYTRYTTHDARHYNYDQPNHHHSSSVHQQHQPQSPVHNNNNTVQSSLSLSPMSNASRSSSFAERRRHQEMREFRQSSDVTTESAGIPYDTGGAGMSSQPQQQHTTNNIQISNDDLKDILSTAAAATVGVSTTGATTGGGDDRTSINLADYSATGQRIGNNNPSQNFVVTNRGNNNSGLYSNMATSTTAAATAGAANPTTTAMAWKKSSILKKSSYSSSTAAATSSTQLLATNNNNQQQQQQQNKVDWGDNRTIEIEDRFSPTPMMMNMGTGDMSMNHNNNNNHNNYNRRDSGGNSGMVSHPNHNLHPNNNHNFTRRQQPPNNHQNFNRRDSGGTDGGGGGGGGKRRMGGNAPCALLGHENLHKWIDCPNNDRSKNYNGIHHRTASHAQILESVKEQRAEYERRMQQHQRQRQHIDANANGLRATASSSRSAQQPPPVLASASLQRPAASKPNHPTSAVAAARRSTELASNMFNTTKSARTPTVSQHHSTHHRRVPSATTTAAAAAGGNSSSSNLLSNIGRQPPNETSKLKQMRKSNELRSSIVKNSIPRKSQQQPPPQQQQQQRQHPVEAPQRNVEYKNGRFQRKTSRDVAPSGRDALPIAKQTSGRLVKKTKKPSSSSRIVSNDHQHQNVEPGDDDTDGSHHTLMDDDDIVEMVDFDLKDDSVDDDKDDGDKKRKAEPDTVFKIMRDPEKNNGSVNRKKKKASGGEKKESITKKKKKNGDNRSNEKKKPDDTNLEKDTKGDDKVAKKKKPDDNTVVQAKSDADVTVEKKKKKKQCRKANCSTKRAKGSKFCRAHTVDKKSDDAPLLSSIAAKPAASNETENVQKSKPKKRGKKRKAPPELAVGEPSTTGAGVPKRQTLTSHRGNNRNSLDPPRDQVANEGEMTFPELDDTEICEMEVDLFNLLDQTIKITYEDYIEQNQINEDVLSRLEMERDESPMDDVSLSGRASSPDEVEIGDKENMSSALLNSVSTMDTSDDDEQIPLFFTCEKCDRVFFAKSQVDSHENQCTGEVLDGKVFNNPEDIAEFYEEHQTGGELKSDYVLFYRPSVTATNETTGRTISPEDSEARGGNRKDAPQNLFDDFMSSKSSRSSSTSKKKKKKQSETEFEIDPRHTRQDCFTMNNIEQLSSTKIDPDTRLPRQTITTICGDTETLYDFSVKIKPSNIPNSGFGCFLTFQGARVLRKEASKRNARLFKEHMTYHPETHKELVAQAYGDRKMHVTLTGSDLHHNDNYEYWSKNRNDYLDAHIKKYGRILDDFDEEDICCKVHSEVKRLRSKIPKRERIGFLGIHSESDYVKDDSVVFSSAKKGLGMIELGRYGPHRRQDVKDTLHHDVKNFIFNFVLSEWSYGIGEKRLGRDQVVDITDDATGDVHSVARQSTPIYVNEVGHDKKLHCNVDIRNHLTHDSVYYYIYIDKEHAMKAGDEVELLVDYTESYEETRERKGYGKNNNEMNGGDDDDAARLRRNFVEREQLKEDISVLKLFDMFYLVEFLANDVFVHIDKRIRESLSTRGQNESFDRLSKDIIARQRMHWLSVKLLCRLKEMVEKKDNEDGLLVIGKEMIATTEKELLSWEFTSLPDIFSLLGRVSNGSGKTLQDVILFELSEELLFSSTLPDPLNGKMWSRIGCDLTERSAREIARYLFCCKEPHYSRLGDLAKQLMLGAKDAADSIREAAHAVANTDGSLPKDAVDILSFHSLRRKLKKKDISPKGELINAYCNDVTLHYGTAAAVADIQAYQDAVELGNLEPFFDPCVTRRKITDSKLSIVSKYASRDLSDTSQQFQWMARSINAFENGVARVNEEWYLMNQVLLPIHTLASACVEWGEFQFYTLEKVCETIGISLADAKEALRRGVARPNWPELVEERQEEGGTSPKKKRRRLRGLSSEARTLYKGPACDEFPGWTVHSIQRKNSHHVDSYWSCEGLDVVVRSKVGVREMIQKMEENRIDAAAAYNILVREGKKKFFGGRKS